MKKIGIFVLIVVIVVVTIVMAQKQKARTNEVQPGNASVINDGPASADYFPTAGPTTDDSVTPSTDLPVLASVVTYSATGFSPNSLTVKAGTTVTFKNETTGTMWVASDPHPTHTSYAEFDAKKGFASGESYSYTFNKVGSWSYHDHLHAGFKGIVIVE